jgi:hypothetical protein
MTDDATTRWLIVCDCAGHPEELIGEVDVDASGKARVWSTGRSGGAPSLKGANRMILNTPIGERADLLKKLRTREIALPATVSFFHLPCGKNIRVSESHLGELLAAVSKAVQDRRVSLALLCAFNSRHQRGATR